MQIYKLIPIRTSLASLFVMATILFLSISVSLFANEDPGEVICPEGINKVINYDLVVSGDTVTSTFSIASGCADVEVSLASYEAPALEFKLPQTLLDSDTGIFDEGGPYTMTADIPECFYQTDLAIGSVIVDLAEDNLYGPKLLKALHGGTGSCDDSESSSTQTQTQTQTIPTAPSCPFEPQDGRIIVNIGADMSRGESLIRADKDLSQATKGPYSVNIPAGTYDITLASWDGYENRSTHLPHQLNESYYLILKDSDGALILNTNAISDLPDDQDFKTLTEEVHTNLVLNEDVSSVTAFHSAYEANAESLTPLCASFDKVEEGNSGGGGGGEGGGVAPVCPLPEISSSLSVSVAVDQAFSYTITATSSTSTTTVFSVATSSLPEGLSFSTSTGAITGTSTEVGTFEVPITVSTDCGTDSKTLVITVTSDTGTGGGGGGGTTTTTTSGGGGGSRSWDFNRGSSGGGVVLGATTDNQCNYLRDFLRIDFNNDPLEVLKLQAFLINFEGHTDLTLNGVFDQTTFNAVSEFQTKYFNDILAPWGHTGPTGYVYITTRKKINEIYCQRAHPLTPVQIEEINAFRSWLQSVDGADSKLFNDKTGAESEWEGDRGTTSTTTSPLLPRNEEDCPNCLTNQGQTYGNFGTLAAAIFTQPGNLLDTAKCVYWALLILLALYVLGSILKNVFYENTSENERKRFLVKGLTIDLGLIVAFVLAYVFGWWCLLLPLLIALIISLIWTALYPEHNSLRASVKSWYLVGHGRVKTILKESTAKFSKQSEPQKNKHDNSVIALPEESKSKK